MAYFLSGRLRLLLGRVHAVDLLGLPLPLVGPFYRIVASPLVHDLRSSLHDLRRLETGGYPDGGEMRYSIRLLNRVDSNIGIGS